MRRLAALVALSALPLPAAWTRLSTPHFEMYTNAGERPGRALLERLELVRHAFHNVSRTSALPLPVRVFYFGSQSEFREFRIAENASAYSQMGPDRDYIVLYAGPEAGRAAAHEYVHLFLNHSSARLPRWLEEGLAEFYSTIEVSGTHLYVGRVISNHVQTLASRGWIEPRAFASAEHQTREYTERDRSGVFYAQSWALVHMLNVAPPWRGSLGRFAELLAEARPVDEAFQAAFGKGLETVLGDLRGYISQRRFGVLDLQLETAGQASVPETRVLTQMEVDVARVDLLLRISRPEQAQELIRKLARTQAGSPEVEFALGSIALNRRNPQAAKRHFARAIELGTTRAEVFFEYALLLRDSGAAETEVTRHLLRAVELNAAFAEAHFVLGLAASRAGRHDDAIERFQHAVAVLPRQASFWHSLALEYHRVGRTELARRAAHRSLDAASTEQQAERARAALRLVNEPAKPKALGPPVVTPEAWFGPRGNRRAEGVLRHVDCLGESARLHLSTASGTLLLWVEHPRSLRTVGAFEFQCGPQERPLAVEYAAQPEAKTNTDGTVTAIETR
jgi:tetratricopeptide (TPR) repeat protein